MKTLSLIILSILSFSMISSGASKRVAIKKVIAAIEKDADEALKEYSHFQSRYAVTPDTDPKNLNGKEGFVKGTEQRYITNNLSVSISDGKKRLYDCSLERFTDDKGKEKVRIRMTKIIK